MLCICPEILSVVTAVETTDITHPELSVMTGLGMFPASAGMNHNQDSTEQLFISGMTGVKAYTESVSLDNGYVANAELRYALPTLLGIKHALGLFADNGWVYAQNGDYTTDDKTTISDVGLGYYMSFKRAFGSVQLAEPIGRSGNRNVKDPGTRVLVQVGVAF